MAGESLLFFCLNARPPPECDDTAMSTGEDAEGPGEKQHETREGAQVLPQQAKDLVSVARQQQGTTGEEQEKKNKTPASVIVNARRSGFLDSWKGFAGLITKGIRELFFMASEHDSRIAEHRLPRAIWMCVFVCACAALARFRV